MSEPLEPPHVELKHRLAIAMDNAGIRSAEDMAPRMGISVGTVRNYLTGRTVPSYPALRLWADLTGAPVDWLRYGTSPAAVTE